MVEKASSDLSVGDLQSSISLAWALMFSDPFPVTVGPDAARRPNALLTMPTIQTTLAVIKPPKLYRLPCWHKSEFAVGFSIPSISLFLLFLWGQTV